MTIHHHTLGSGPQKIIALHGWLSDHQVYEPAFRHFDQDRFTVAFADWRGYGRSRGMNADYTSDQMADDVAALAAKLGWQRCHLVGHSMGGTAVLKTALRHPDLVASGVAVTPVPASGHALDEGTRRFFELAAEDDTALAEIFNALTGQRHSRNFLAGMVAATRESTGASILLGYLDTWTLSDFGDELSGLDMPFLVITGQHDGALGLETIREPMARQLKRVQFETIASAGHYPMVETPVELVDRIEAFIAAVAGR